MKKFNTLWSILEQFGIEIPPIQRDFAQGRETKQAEKVRESFLNSLCKALKMADPLSLDFVYGKIYGLKNEEEHRRNKNAIQCLVNSVRDFASTIDLVIGNVIIEDKSTEKAELVYLIPLDGQQRLTTLFLLHWYIAKRIGKKDALTILDRFRYKTRKSSASFLKLINSEKIHLNFVIETPEYLEDIKDSKLYQEITDLEFFSSAWLNDPTVKAMLIVIQEIHFRLQSLTEEQLNIYWVGLTENELLRFDFLNLKDFNLSDELYVKMNARGKQLSSFENFKAWLFGQINDKTIFEKKIWEIYSKKFDIEWNDIFWRQKGTNVFDVDNAYFNFFKILFLYNNVKTVKLEGTNFNIKTMEFLVIDTVINNTTFEWENLCNEFFEENIKNYLNILILCEEFIPNNKYLQDFFEFQYSTKSIKPSWQNLIKNFITLSFITVKNKPIKDYSINEFNQFNEYHRVLFNLFDNTIIDNQLLYQNAIKEIEELNISLNKVDYSIENWVDDFEYTTKSIFIEQQLLEEVLKYRLFKNEVWKEMILDSESISYFERQLNFWFYRCRISLKKEDFNEGLLSDKGRQNIFRETTEKIKLLIDEKGLNRKLDFSQHIFERALLSKSDYLLSEKGYKCFGRNSGRDVSWKRLFFRDRNSELTNSALLEVFDLDFSDVKKNFTEYINKNIVTNPLEQWRKIFVLNSEIYNFLGDLKYIRNIENHGWVIIKDAYKTYIGEHYELFSLDFYIKYRNHKSFMPFIEMNYYPAPKNNKDDFPCTYLDWKSDHFNYALDIKFIFGKYCLILFSRDKPIDEIIQRILVEQKFSISADYFLKDLDSQEDVIIEIKALCSILNTINA